jgi:hypothetical protein
MRGVDILTTMLIKVPVLWDVTPWRQVSSYRQAYWNVLTLKVKELLSFENAVFISRHGVKFQ